MKYDINRTPSRSAKRVLGALSDSLVSILLTKRFEDITVGEICDESGYPRATFYNYFDDKYDLLGFYWYIVFRQVKLEDFITKDVQSSLDAYFERLFDMLDENKRIIKKLLVNNKRDGYFITSCKTYLASNVKAMLNKLTDETTSPVPNDILAEHIANTLLLVFGKHYESNDPDIKKTKSYLHSLLSK